MPATNSIQPFYHWDTIPYVVETPAPDLGVAVNDSVAVYFLPDSAVTVEPAVRPSLFREQVLVARHTDLQPRTDTSAPVWVFGVLVALLALLTLYYRTCKLRFTTLVPLLFDSRAMDRTLRNNNLNRRIRFVPMGILMLFCLMLAVHQTALAKTGVGGYLLLVAAMAAFYLLRNGLLRLLGLVFDNKTAVDLYITSNYLYHLTLASLTLPLLFLQTYLPSGQSVVLTMLAVVVVLEMIMRLFRGMKLFLTQSSGPYVYLFYYLCIVELAPVLVLIKWIVE